VWFRVANSGQDREKKFGPRQETSVGVEITGRTGRPVSNSDRKDRVHQRFLRRYTMTIVII